MQLPPDNIPDGLDAPGYRKLGILYTLMGKQEQAVEAMTRSSVLGGELSSKEKPASLSEDESARVGSRLGANLLKLITRSLSQGTQLGAELVDESESLSEIKGQLELLGVSEEQLELLVTTLRSKLEELSNAEPPPRDVPQDLGAEEYYELAVRYKEAGWTEQSRDALQLAIEKEPGSEAAEKARRFLLSKIPKSPVPLMAEQENIHGFNLVFAGEYEEAARVFLSLIERYPDFEWPYGNLGSLLIRQGSLDDAVTVLEKALSLNEHYLNAWIHMARAKALAGDMEAAHACLDRAASIDSSGSAIAGIRAMLEELV